MNIFKAISITLDSTISVLTKGLKAIDNVAEMAEQTSAAMLLEQKEEAAQSLRELKKQSSS